MRPQPANAPARSAGPTIPEPVISIRPYENEQTEITLSGSTTAFDGILPNARIQVSPEVDVPTACTLMHGDDIFTLKAVRQPVPGFVLHEGDNRVSITGARRATFYYRKGCL